MTEAGSAGDPLVFLFIGGSPAEVAFPSNHPKTYLSKSWHFRQHKLNARIACVCLSGSTLARIRLCIATEQFWSVRKNKGKNWSE
ncbi:hypothetical protein I4641_21095 [Waterburya agarophytonicola K14]|uniref:Uncharacterized protein n=1 Tax=Waterburya agarophytonicola KI4 TaxID=2874699 RepID=A0A964BU11_9CYAN|nr:hypothetical protein [Waterburya agarophytonicola]MCC0179460.1 hypothetical protein [Waterburya agarophytonicola KI4]